MYWIDVTGYVADKLSGFPLSTQSRLIERAINAALDAEGWPGDTVAEPAYWFVNIFERGQLLGHVGPISDKARADRAAASWRESGRRARVSLRGIGPALTNARA